MNVTEHFPRIEDPKIKGHPIYSLILIQNGCSKSNIDDYVQTYSISPPIISLKPVLVFSSNVITLSYLLFR